jgi:hypothetical protein
MSDKAFEDFVNHHLVTLDELARRYADYRKEVSESWWRELSGHIRAKTPVDYRFLDDKFLKRQNGSVEGEHRCGWSRNLEISGVATVAAICFGVNVPVLDFAGRWPFMNNTCWTGIKVGLPANTRTRLSDIARRVPMHSGPVEGDWVLWPFWEPLCLASVEGLHEHLTGDQRHAEQQEIVGELEQWRESFEKILSQLG